MTGPTQVVLIVRIWTPQPDRSCACHSKCERRLSPRGPEAAPPAFKATIPTERLETYLASDCYKKPNREKWTYEEIGDYELFTMHKSRSKLKDPNRPSTFLREHNPSVTWASRTRCLNAAEKVITATHSAFRDRAEFADQLAKSGGNSDLRPSQLDGAISHSA